MECTPKRATTVTVTGNEICKLKIQHENSNDLIKQLYKVLSLVPKARPQLSAIRRH